MLQIRNDITSDNRKDRLKWLVVIGLILLGVIYCIPMFSSAGIHKLDDTTFHVGRLVGLANVWTSPVNFDSFGNNGLMVNVFYPWLTLYPMRILYEITGTYVAAYKLYHMLMAVATLLIAEYSMQRISGNRISAFMFAVLYAFSSYRFADVYNRDALGEMIALTFLPLVLLGLYKICFENYREWNKLAVGMTLIAYSHILSLCMAAAFVGVTYLVTLLLQDNRAKRFGAMVKAACMAVGLSLAMIVPMLEQFIRNDLFTPEGSGDTLSGSAYSPVEIIRFTIGNNPAGRGIGLMSLAAMAAACLLLVYIVISKKNRGEGSTGSRFALCMLLIGALIFACTSDIVPWQMLGDRTPIATLQFVWRLNAYPTLAFASAFAVTAALAMKSTRRNAIILLAAVVLAGAGLQFVSLYTQNADIVTSEAIAEEDIASWPSGNVDYAPYQAKEYRDSDRRNMEYVFINGEKTAESPVTEDRGSCYVMDLGSSETDRTVDIPVLRYYGQDAELNGEPAEAVMSKRGTTEINIPGSDSAEVRISYRYTTLARIAWIMSVIILAFDIVLMVRRRILEGKASS